MRDIIRSKEAARRAEDRVAIPELRALAGLPRPSDIATRSFPRPATSWPKELSAQEQIAAARAAAATRRRESNSGHTRPGSRK